MNRTLTAAVALAAGLGMAGLAHAQSSAGPSTTPSTQMTPPPTSPNAIQNPTAAPGTASPYGAQNPQANAQTNQMDQGGQQMSPSQVLQAQQELKSQGLYRGAVDGVVGPETQTAVSQFQKQQGLPQTAQLDQQTLDRLTGSNTGAAQGTRTAPMGTQNPAMQNSPPTNR